MSLLDELTKESTWQEFRDYKDYHSHISNKDLEALDAFIDARGYLPLAQDLADGGYSFGLPKKSVINKSGSRKKRVVYRFPDAENYILKLMTFLLYRYDDRLSPACYSFRRNLTAKAAIDRMLHIPHVDEKWVLKVDISNYFNSMPAEKLVAVLEGVVSDDPALLEFFRRFLLENKAVEWQRNEKKTEDGCTHETARVVEENRGAMAGVPVSVFFANVYLLSLDRLFTDRGIPYFRYSDDILVFADSEEELMRYAAELEAHIEAKGLALNPDKQEISRPGEPIDFLGFRYHKGKVDLAPVTLEKMKAKIRRKGRALYRWRTRKGVDFEHTAKVMTRIFNSKFYDLDGDNEFTWSRWFFPVITSDAGLKELDDYLVQYIRYIYSGRHYKGNYRISYEQVKELGFRSLVNEYYKFRKEENG